jgi:hypothetical protein
MSPWWFILAVVALPLAWWLFKSALGFLLPISFTAP